LITAGETSLAINSNHHNNH